MSLMRYRVTVMHDPPTATGRPLHERCEVYRAEDVRAVLEPFLHRLVISERTPQELKDWAYRLLQELVP